MLNFLSIFLINTICGTTGFQNMNNFNSMTKIEIRDTENEKCEPDKGEESSPLLNHDIFKTDKNTLTNVEIGFDDSKEESVSGSITFENTGANGGSIIYLDMEQVYNETTTKDIALKEIEKDSLLCKYFVKISVLMGILSFVFFSRNLFTDYFCLKLGTSKKVKICLTIVLSVLTLLVCIGSSYK